MNINKIYSRSVGREKQPQEEEPNLDKELLKQQRLNWLQHPNTVELLGWLKKQELLCYDNAVKNTMSGQSKPDKQLIKANTIKEIIEYARGN